MRDEHRTQIERLVLLAWPQHAGKQLDLLAWGRGLCLVASPAGGRLIAIDHPRAPAMLRGALAAASNGGQTEEFEAGRRHEHASAWYTWQEQLARDLSVVLQSMTPGIASVPLQSCIQTLRERGSAGLVGPAPAHELPVLSPRECAKQWAWRWREVAGALLAENEHGTIEHERGQTLLRCADDLLDAFGLDDVP